MKIGLYGDSFGIADVKELPTAWYNLLRDELQCELDNYAVRGSSVYFSFKNFLETYHMYDLVIFLVTSPIRYSKSLNTSTPIMEHYPGISAVKYAREIYNNQLTDTDREILRDLEGWFMCSDEELNLDMCELMMERVANLHENVLFIPVIENTYFKNNTGITNREHTFYNFVSRQLTLLKLLPGYDVSKVMFGERPETIAGHLGPEFNRFVADVMYKGITTGVWDWSMYDQVTLEHPKEFYYNLD